MEEPKFKVSYDMESEYEYQGKLYRIRLGAHRQCTSADYFPTIVKCIGTVMYHDSREFHEFPAPEVVEMFSKMMFGVSLVAAKWSQDYDVIYNGERPACHEDDRSVWMTQYIERFNAWFHTEAA